MHDRLPPTASLFDALRDARDLLNSVAVEPDQLPVAGLVLAAIDRGLSLLEPGPGTSTETVAEWVEEAESPRLYEEALDLLQERRMKALEINDDVVQRLTVAKLALDLGRREELDEALDGAVAAARKIISDLMRGSDEEARLGPGDLRTNTTPDD